MRRELLASKKKETGLSLDPRTKLALLVTIALFVLSGGGGAASKQFAPILAAVPLILLLTEKSWKGSVIYFVLYGGSYILQLWALPHLSGLPNFLVVAICGFFMRFVPGIMMGYIFLYAVCAGDYDGIHHGQDDDGQRVCCRHEEAAFTGADHHSYVRDIPIFPYCCRRI